MPDIVLILHNIRSTYNVGSLFRTAEGFGVKRIIISGYTPYPLTRNDPRLPHISHKLDEQIHKTALGAEKLVPFDYVDEPPLSQLKAAGYRITGLEQHDWSVPLSDYRVTGPLALVLGEEITGIDDILLANCDDIVEIPMVGQKESFNVSVAAGIALYQLTSR